MKRFGWFILAAAVAPLAFADASEAQYASRRVASGLTRPTYVTALPGDTDRVFVLEQPGRIRIIKNGTLLARPFLAIEADVHDTNDEQGLLGLCFDPDFESNRRFFVYFTGGTGNGNSQIRRYEVTSDPDSADAATSFKIFQYPQPFTNHNGGQIEFGDDGYLYVGLGDGGSAGDPGNRAQNGNVLLGKMLRIDVNGDAFPGDANNNYAIPPTNPFIGDPNVLDEIWAIGMRNPYRWSFDRLTKDLYIGDVGQGAIEEIDFEPADDPGGRNYGWRLMEGDACFNPPVNCDDGSPVLTYPVHTYLHSPPEGGFNCSITGGYVYRGSFFPELQGRYFFADYCSDKIWTIFMVGGVATELTERTQDIASLDGFVIRDITSIGEDAAGELYFTDRGGAVAGQGEVYRLVPSSSGIDVGGPSAPGGAAIQLSRVAPNPFRGTATIELNLARAGAVELGIYGASGRLVRRVHSGELTAGRHVFTWDGLAERGAPAVAGIYFVRAEGLGATSTERVAFLR